MSSGVETRAVPPAWYTDPSDPRRMRWWNGVTWTEHTSDPAPAPPVSPSPAPVLSSPESPASLSPSTLSPASESAAPFTPSSIPIVDWSSWQGSAALYDPASASIEATVLADDEATNGSTMFLWLFALVPITVVGLALVSGPLGVAIAVAIPVVLSVALARLDAGRLRAQGWRDVPSPLLALVPPLYLGLRVARIGRASIAALASWLAVQVAAVALLTAFGSPMAPVTDQSTMSLDDTLVETPPSATFTEAVNAELLTPEGMAAQVVSELELAGLTVDGLSCEPLAGVEVGTRTTCTGTAGDMAVTVGVQVVEPSETAPPFVIVERSTMPTSSS